MAYSANQKKEPVSFHFNGKLSRTKKGELYYFMTMTDAGREFFGGKSFYIRFYPNKAKVVEASKLSPEEMNKKWVGFGYAVEPKKEYMGAKTYQGVDFSRAGKAAGQRSGKPKPTTEEEITEDVPF